jgi:hypothetical protein
MNKSLPDEFGHDPSARPAFSPDGVDLTLIRWMKSLSPRERLLALQGVARSLQKLKHARTRA